MHLNDGVQGSARERASRLLIEKLSLYYEGAPTQSISNEKIKNNLKVYANKCNEFCGFKDKPEIFPPSLFDVDFFIDEVRMGLLDLDQKREISTLSRAILRRKDFYPLFDEVYKLLGFNE